MTFDTFLTFERFPVPFWNKDTAILYFGDVREQLRRLPARSVHAVVTSPPYWALKDYQTGSAQLGLEEQADCCGWANGKACGECYTCHMVEVFAEVRRVLRDDGTLWLNLGDTYDNDGELVGIPWRTALALKANGWKLRAAIPWIKRNAMPDSAMDRPGKATEDVFLLVKSDSYYFDMEAVKVPATGVGGGGAVFGKPGESKHRRYDRPNYKYRAWRSHDLWISETDIEGFDVPIANFSGAHYATFNPRLIAPMILASTSEHGCCAKCSSPYRPVVSKEKKVKEDDTRCKYDRSFKHSRNGLNSTLRSSIGGSGSSVEGWVKTCGCHTQEVEPCIVLDPFVGSGTTVAVAVKLGRIGIGIDLNEEYLRDNAIPRISGEKVSRKPTFAMPPDVPPPPERLF